jgi:hypothetical protein
MKNVLCPATTLLGSATLPLVISTEAERRDLCVDGLSWECFSRQRTLQGGKPYLRG